MDVVALIEEDLEDRDAADSLLSQIGASIAIILVPALSLKAHFKLVKWRPARLDWNTPVDSKMTMVLLTWTRFRETTTIVDVIRIMEEIR